MFAAGLVSATTGDPARAGDDRLAIGSSGLKVTAQLLDAGDHSPTRLHTGQDLRVVLSFSRASDGQTVSGLTPRVFIRRLVPGVTSCTNAAWAVRATGVISPDDMAMERSYLVAVGHGSGDGREDQLRVVDFGHQLASANQVSVTPLGGRAAALLVHPGSTRAFVALPGNGEIVAVDLPWGGAERFATGLKTPRSLAPLASDLLVAEEAGTVVRFDAQGIRRDAITVGPHPQLHVLSPDLVLASGADGLGALISKTHSPVLFAAGTLQAPLAAAGEVIVSRAADATLAVRWIDDASHPVPVVLPFVPEGVLVTSSGRFAFTWSAGRQAAVIDLAAVGNAGFGISTLELSDQVDDAIEAPPAIILTHRSAPTASVVDLAAMEVRGAPLVRRIRLPLPQGNAETEATHGRLALLPGGSSAVTIRPGSNVAFTLAAGGGLTDQPMAATTVRGDFPHLIAAFDTRMQETEPGRFTGKIRFTRGGAYEVVATTGPGGSTSCSKFAVEGPGDDEVLPVILRLTGNPPAAGHPVTLQLVLENAQVGIKAVSGFLRIDDLAFGGSQRVAAQVSDDGVMSAQALFPEPGLYALSLEGSSDTPPLVLDVRQ